MRLTNLLVIPAAVAAIGFAAGPASAGEITGTGKPTPATSNAHSICVFSGLEDGDDDDDGVPELPSGPGVTPQNWGHVKQFLRSVGAPAEEIAGSRPGVTCNGHTGIIASGGGE
jgi:hypothetical protein